MDSMNHIIVTTHEDGILQLTLNRPTALNALNHQLLQQLSSLLDQARDDKGVKALLINGEGKAFCAGADIKELSTLKGADGIQFANFGQSVFQKLESLGKPSLAAIHGFAFGGGCELSLAATLRIASKNTMFGQPEIKLGVIPGFGGTQRLPRLIGRARALELCLTGKRFSAEDAHQWGMVNELTTMEELLPRAKAMLKEIAQHGRIALASIMTAINQGTDLSLADGLQLEAAYFGLCCDTADKREGVNAFLEKRTAQFSGE